MNKSEQGCKELMEHINKINSGDKKEMGKLLKYYPKRIVNAVIESTDDVGGANND